ncbi:MAG: carbohydrate binding domain-containing protein, partial [Verrucomicrobiota bacterium]
PLFRLSCLLVTSPGAEEATELAENSGSFGGALLRNGDFERGTEGWNALWSRGEGAGSAALDTAERHGGTQSLRIEHTGREDWSLAQARGLNVQAGEIYELSAWCRVRGPGRVTLGVVTRDGDGKTIDWAYGAKSAHETDGWIFLRSHFIIPPGVAAIWPRLIGDGPVTVWCDDFSLTRQGNLSELRVQGLPEAVVARNAAIGLPSAQPMPRSP